MSFAQGEIEPNNTAASATSLDLSAGFVSVQAAISASGDTDFFSFSAPAGSRAWILVDTGGTSGPAADSRDSFLVLYEGNGTTVVEEDDDDGSGNGCDSTEESQFASAIAGRVLSAGGTYYIRVTEFGDDGIIAPYRLVVALTTSQPVAEVEPNGSSLAPNALLTQPQSIGLRAGSVASPGDVDYYSVELKAGDTVFIAADCDPVRGGSGTDLELALLGTDRATLLYLANSSGDEASAAEAFCFTVGSAGAYYVRVRHVDSGTGVYHIMAATRPPGSLQFISASWTALEGAGPVTITVERAGSAAGAVNVHYATADNTAAAPADYQSASGTLFFGDGVTRQTFTVNLASDTLVEPNEAIDLVLSLPSGGAALGAQNQARLVILDDDEVPNNSASTATPLRFQLGLAAVTNIAGAGLPMLSPPGDEDWYSLTAPPSSRVWILVDTGGPQLPGGNSRDSKLTLLGADGQTVIEFDDDDGVGNGCGPIIDPEGDLASAISARRLIAGGTYYIRVQAFDPEAIVAPYRLFVLLSSEPALSEKPQNDGPLGADPIIPETGVLGGRLAEIAPAGDEDWYSVKMAQNGFLWAAVDADPERGGSATDIVLDLFGPDGTTLLLSVDSSAEDPEAAESVCYQVGAAGTYYVRIRHFLVEGTGSYSLSVVRWPGDLEPNDNAATASVLNLIRGRAEAAGAIGIPGDQDYYRFTAGATTRLWALVDTGGEQTPDANSRASILTLLAGDGTTVIEEDRSDGIGNGADNTIESPDGSVICGRTLVAGGNYYLRVRGASPSGLIHPYRLLVTVTTNSPLIELEQNNEAATATPLLDEFSAAGVRQGSLSSVSDVDVYSLRVVPGTLLHLGLDADPERDGTGSDVHLELLAPDGATVLLDADSSTVGSLADPAAEGFSFRITNPGVHYARIRSARGGFGTYLVMAARAFQPLKIVSRQINGQDVRIGFTGLSGLNYRVVRSSSLTGGEGWTPVTGVIAGNDGVIVGTDMGGAGASQAFYRVIQVP